LTCFQQLTAKLGVLSVGRYAQIMLETLFSLTHFTPQAVNVAQLKYGFRVVRRKFKRFIQQFFRSRAA
jgi:hypothetical protein